MPKLINSFSILALSLSLFACNGINHISTNKDDSLKKNKEIVNKILIGKVLFPENFSTKASISEIANKATVSVIYPNNHSEDNLKNATIATGLTDDSGNFKINFNLSFSPNINQIYILEATKRISGAGNSNMSVRTYIKWNGLKWEGMTKDTIIINEATTTLSLINNYQPDVLPIDQTINSLDIDNGKTVISDIGNLKVFDIERIKKLVSHILTNSRDPIEYIGYKENSFYLKNPNKLENCFACPEILETATFNGKVLDNNFNPVDGVIVSAKSIDPGVNWVGTSFNTINGAYIFHNVPVGARVQIVVQKPGWTTRVRTEVVKSNLTGDPRANVFNFGGTGSDSIFAIQDEPEITSIKVNGKFATGEGSDVESIPTISVSSNISGVDPSNLEVEMIFSEPINRESFENSFRINSQLFGSIHKSIEIDRNTPIVSFIWSEEDKKVIFNTNQALFSINNSGNSSKYNINFKNNFKDKTEKESANKKIRFTSSTFGDNLVFSVINNIIQPKITNFEARDGGGSNDKLIITYNKSFSVIGKTSEAVKLSEPQGNGISNQSQNGSSLSDDGGAGHTYTLLGYKDGNNNFKYSYMVGILRAGFNGKFSENTRLIALENNSFVSAKINDKTITIDLNTDAFKKDDRVIISAGSPIIGNFKFNDVINTSQNISLKTNTNVEHSFIIDPSGNLLSSGNQSEFQGVTISDNQKVSTAS